MSASERIQQQLQRANATPDIFTVFVGSSEKRHDLKKSVLCERSVYFKTLVSQNIHLGWHKLPWANIRAWDVFALWLINGDILDPPADNPNELPPSLHHLALLYELAIDYKVGAFLPKVIAAIFRRLAHDSTTTFQVDATIRFLLSRQKFVSPIREILVGWLVNAAPWTDVNVDVIWKMPPPIPHEVFKSIGQLAPRDRQQWAKRNIDHYSTIVFNF